VDADLDLSVLICTTGRRQELLERVVEAYRDTVPSGVCFEVDWQAGDSTIGERANQLYARSRGALVFFACDDAVPQPGWYEASTATLAEGKIPAVRFMQDGKPLHELYDAPAAAGQPFGFTRMFLLPRELRELVGDSLPIDWYGDIDYSQRVEAAGWPIVSCPGMVFEHLNGPRDWQNEQRDHQHYELYQASRGVR